MSRTQPGRRPPICPRPLAGVITTVAAVAAVAVLAGARPAAAHAVLLASNPAEDAVVTEALDIVRLEFNEPVSPLQVTVAGPEGVDVAAGEPTSGVVVEQPLGAFSRTGEYTVTWRVISADDHHVEGAFGFTYRGPVDQADTAPREQPAATDQSGLWVLLAAGSAALLALGLLAARALHRPGGQKQTHDHSPFQSSNPEVGDEWLPSHRRR